jgi:hypothetical protein
MDYTYPHHQPPTPNVSAQEKARRFAPDYDQELTEWETAPSEWQHLCSCRFGPARNSHIGHPWSGDSYRYDLYARPEHRKLALRWQNGSGCGWLTCDDLERREETNLLRVIAALSDESRRWDACHFLYQTAHKTALAAALTETRRLSLAFLEHRLKRVKVRGRNAHRVEVLPQPPGQAEVQRRFTVAAWARTLIPAEARASRGPRWPSTASPPTPRSCTPGSKTSASAPIALF